MKIPTALAIPYLVDTTFKYAYPICCDSFKKARNKKMSIKKYEREVKNKRMLQAN